MTFQILVFYALSVLYYLLFHCSTALSRTRLIGLPCSFCSLFSVLYYLLSKLYSPAASKASGSVIRLDIHAQEQGHHDREYKRLNARHQQFHDRQDHAAKPA